MVYQSSASDCGKAAVRETLRLVYRDESFATEPIEEDCSSFSSMKRALGSFGADYEGYEVDNLSALKKNLPAICQLDEEGVLHFVVLRKIGARSVYLSDPEFGELHLKREDFLAVFTRKALLKKESEKKRKGTEFSLLKGSDGFCYFLLFLLESLALLALLFFAPQKDGFPFAVASAVLFGVLILIQNLYNGNLQNRLDEDIFLPYLHEVGKKGDIRPLSKTLGLTIKENSSFISYSVLAVGLIYLLLEHGDYLSLLLLLSLLFSLFRYLLRGKKNATDRYCSLKERAFAMEVGKDSYEFGLSYKESKKKALNYLYSLLVSWVIEGAALSLFILIVLHVESQLSSDLFLYYFGLALAFSYALRKLEETYRIKEEKTREINALSYPLPTFVLKRKSFLDYTKGTDSEGGNAPDEKETDSGIPGPDEEEEPGQAEENIYTVLPAYPIEPKQDGLLSGEPDSGESGGDKETQQSVPEDR